MTTYTSVEYITIGKMFSSSSKEKIDDMREEFLTSSYLDVSKIIEYEKEGGGKEYTFTVSSTGSGHDEDDFLREKRFFISEMLK